MPKVLVLTRYERLGASSRVRFLQFLPRLEQQGFSFAVAPFLTNAHVRALYEGQKLSAAYYLAAYARRLRTLLTRHRYDLLWIEKEALPWLPAWIETAITRDIPSVVDFDDAWFHRYRDHVSPRLGCMMPHKIEAVMRNASIVVAGNDVIADHARQAGARRVEIVPSVIDLDRYPAPPAAAEPKRPIVVGWIGIPLNAHYLVAIAPALKALMQAGVIRLHLVGTQAPAAFAGCPVETFAWSEDSEIERIGAFDVGIMPLADEPWERGKSAYKLLQVMAAGKPVVASPVGANRNVVDDGVNGLLASSPDQWIASLTRLADDAALRHRMGLEARRTVSEQYSLAGALPRMAAILSDAIAQGARASIAR